MTEQDYTAEAAHRTTRGLFFSLIDSGYLNGLARELQVIMTLSPLLSHFGHCTHSRLLADIEVHGGTP